MPRAIWKGAISFGLVHVPVALHPAAEDHGIDFDWLDRRHMDPVGYQRINKRTGKPVPKEQIVRGVKVGDGRYVVLGDDEIRAAYPRSTQTIEIEAFVAPTAVPFTLLERPYYLAPQPKAEKVYTLLREAMADAAVVGVARVVLHTKEHLAVLVPAGPALMLDTLRWAADVRHWDDLELPPAGRKALAARELAMARALIDDMTVDWQPERYSDRFTDAVQALVERRAKAGKTEAVQPMEDAVEAAADNVVDLTELLKRSLGRAPAAKATKTTKTTKTTKAARQRA